MEHITEPTLFAFLLQVTILGLPPLISLIAYRWSRIPLKRNRATVLLAQIGITPTKELNRTISAKYSGRDYIWPLFLMLGFGAVTFAITHPFFNKLGIWAGLLPEVINIFGVDDLFPRSILIGHVMFYAWLGAYTYAFVLIGRRFLDNDLEPSVYYFITIRFALSYFVGAVVSGAIGHLASKAGVPFDTALGTAAIVAFFIGCFPEQGVNWIVATAKNSLKQAGRMSKEIPLSEVEGLSIWHQGRLSQEKIENVQNLAMSDIPTLIVDLPFSLYQIIDWIDQSILLLYASPSQLAVFTQIGLRTASDVITATSNEDNLRSLYKASGLPNGSLEILCLALQSAPNSKIILRARIQLMDDLTEQEQSPEFV